MKKIVIVEDDTWLAEHYSRILTKAGYSVHLAPHALDAIDIIDEVEPDGILLDMLLAGVSGLALLHEMASHSDLAKIPIVVATNLGDQINENDLRPYGVSRLLDKATMTPDDVAAAFRAVVE